jgi:hypothetical protein
MEGDVFWCVRTSPVHVRKVFLYKTVAAILVVSLIAQCLSVTLVYAFERDAGLTLVAAVVTLCMTLTLVGLNVGGGSYFAMYKEKNPVRVASSQGASLTFLASMVYLSVVIAVLMIPLTKYFVAIDLAPQSTMQWAVRPLIIISVISLAGFGISTAVGVRTISRAQ